LKISLIISLRLYNQIGMANYIASLLPCLKMALFTKLFVHIHTIIMVWWRGKTGI